MANKRQLKVVYYPNNQEEMGKFISQLHITPQTIGLTASFPHLLPPQLISLFNGKLYNIHPSLLPQYRNVAPVPYAIIMGDSVTGVSIFQINNGIDNGQIVAQHDYPISPSDTTPTLLNKLFSLGSRLFAQFLSEPTKIELTSSIRVMKSSELIFTRKLSTESGYIEWSTLTKLINNEVITADDTSNQLILLRLRHHPDRSTHILADLCRGLSGYEKVWSLAPTKKGELRLTIESVEPTLTVKLAGKPKAISWSDFEKYYL